MFDSVFFPPHFYFVVYSLTFIGYWTNERYIFIKFNVFDSFFSLLISFDQCKCKSVEIILLFKRTKSLYFVCVSTLFSIYKLYVNIFTKNLAFAMHTLANKMIQFNILVHIQEHVMWKMKESNGITWNILTT